MEQNDRCEQDPVHPAVPEVSSQERISPTERVEWSHWVRRGPKPRSDMPAMVILHM